MRVHALSGIGHRDRRNTRGRDRSFLYVYMHWGMLHARSMGARTVSDCRLRTCAEYSVTPVPLRSGVRVVRSRWAIMCTCAAPSSIERLSASAVATLTTLAPLAVVSARAMCTLLATSANKSMGMRRPRPCGCDVGFRMPALSESVLYSELRRFDELVDDGTSFTLSQSTERCNMR